MQSLFIPIEPLPCPRPRIVVRGRFPSAYYPASYTKWKAEAEQLIKERLTETYPEGPLALALSFVCCRPKTTKLSHPKPDVDNYAKSVMDALTKAEAWGDDSQVIDLAVCKGWDSPSEKAGIYITIQPLELT